MRGTVSLLRKMLDHGTDRKGSESTSGSNGWGSLASYMHVSQGYVMPFRDSVTDAPR
jgi:hypothetical protein